MGNGVDVTFNQMLSLLYTALLKNILYSIDSKLYIRGVQRKETREPPNALINKEELKCKKKKLILLYT